DRDAPDRVAIRREEVSGHHGPPVRGHAQGGGAGPEEGIRLDGSVDREGTGAVSHPELAGIDLDLVGVAVAVDDAHQLPGRPHGRRHEEEPHHQDREQRGELPERKGPVAERVEGNPARTCHRTTSPGTLAGPYSQANRTVERRAELPMAPRRRRYARGMRPL